MKSKQIQEILFKKYYSDNKFSEVTSSHWRRFGEKTKIIQKDDSFEINACGISSFKRKGSLLGTVRHFVVDYLLSKMLIKYHAQHETIQAAKSITDRLNIHFGFDHAKHVLIFELLDSYGLFNTKDLICIIGDGHGFFGTLIKTLRPDTKILFVNLGRNLIIDAFYFSESLPDIEPLLFQRTNDRQLLESSSVTFLEAEYFEFLYNLPINLFINIASMQEMDISIVNRYFKYIYSSTAEPNFYCLNREEKTLPDGNITRFADYPWGGAKVLLDEICPFYQKYPIWRPPFWQPFDGPIRHRLVKINNNLKK